MSGVKLVVPFRENFYNLEVVLKLDLFEIDDVQKHSKMEMQAKEKNQIYKSAIATTTTTTTTAAVAAKIVTINLFKQMINEIECAPGR